MGLIGYLERLVNFGHETMDISIQHRWLLDLDAIMWGEREISCILVRDDVRFLF